MIQLLFPANATSRRLTKIFLLPAVLNPLYMKLSLDQVLSSKFDW